MKGELAIAPLISELIPCSIWRATRSFAEYAGERLVIEAWGKDGLRVRSTMRPAFAGEDWALLRGTALRTARYFHPG